MPSSDITVVPTGGTSAVNLADLAAQVSALQTAAFQPELQLGHFMFEGGPTGNVLAYQVLKQTGKIETLVPKINGNPVPASAITTVNTLTDPWPDGWYESGIAADAIPGAAGTYTFELVGSVSGALASAQFTVT